MLQKTSNRSCKVFDNIRTMASFEAPGTQEYIEVPAALFSKQHGMSMDFGSSQMKIAYVTPSPSGDKLRINLASYSRERHDDGLQFLAEVYKDHLQPDELVNVTGVNCDVDHVQSKLNIRSNIVLECECLLDGFLLLAKNFPVHDVTFPCPDSVVKYASRSGSHFTGSVDALNVASAGKISASDNQVQDLEHISQSCNGTDTKPEQVIQYPALVCLLGSTYQMTKVNSDDTAKYCDLLPVSGRTLLGLGSLLAQAQSFEELMDLAERGSVDNCDVRLLDLLGKGEDGEYSALKGDFNVFCMGKAVGRESGEMSREDLAAGCVSLVAHTLGFFAHMTAVAHGGRQVFFCGGLTSHQYTRDYIWKIFNYRNLSNQQNYKAEAFFLKYGSFLAVLGCLAKNLQST